MTGKKWSVLLLHLLIPLTASEWCNFDKDDDYEAYCSNGCCGKSCCYDLDENSPMPLIIGCSIGGIFFVATVAAVIYACLRSGTRPGRVISLGGPDSVNTVTITSTGTTFTNYGAQPMMPQPPPYSLTQPPPYTPYPQPIGLQSQAAPDYDTITPPPVYSVQH